MTLLRFTWHRSLAGQEADWLRCFGPDQGQRSHALQLALEEARLDEVEIHSLTVADEQGTAALIPCFSFRISMVTVAPVWVQQLVARIRVGFPGFLRVRIFFVGSPTTTCTDLLGFANLETPGRWPAVRVQAVFAEIERKARELRLRMVVVKELDDRMKGFLADRLGQRYTFAASLPAALLDLPPAERGGYLASIRTRYRNKLKKRKSTCAAAGLVWETSRSCTGHEEGMYSLYRRTLERADSVFERLNRRFIDTIAARMTEGSFYLFGFWQEPGGARRLVSYELALVNRDTLQPVFGGFDHERCQDTDLYFGAFYALIEAAEERGLKRVHLGQTAYEVKAELGATCQSLHIAFRHFNRPIHLLLSALKKVFFPTIRFPARDVFGTPPPPPKTGRARTNKDEALARSEPPRAN
jgi:hypothetical protein